ncbi:MAG: DUF2169 domain-containing protein [Enhygromyxa sp.]
MPRLINLTRFAAACIPSLSKHDEALAVAIVSGTFPLPAPGQASAELTRELEDQPPVRLADVYVGAPERSSLLHEGQSTYFRPGTDIYLTGAAWAPGGRATTDSFVAVRVGAYHKQAMVIGDRVWRAGLQPSQPAPFVSLPLVYERAFGGPGSDFNPVGRGLYGSRREAAGQPLPNFEDPRARVDGPSSRVAACGFGPIARHWQPRRAFAGTYDDQWVETRAPLWPRDFDERLFCAASPGLCATPHLVGGEPVQIAGMSPDGLYSFALPRPRLRARLDTGARLERRTMVLDAVSLEPSAGVLTMIWRACFVADPLAPGELLIRALEPWEGEHAQ